MSYIPSVEMLEERCLPGTLLYYDLWADAKMLKDPREHQLIMEVVTIYNGNNALCKIPGMSCCAQNPENLVLIPED